MSCINWRCRNRFVQQQLEPFSGREHLFDMEELVLISDVLQSSAYLACKLFSVHFVSFSQQRQFYT